MENITLNEFINNFNTIISTIDTPHIDETGTYPGSIGFIITCNSNLRKNYFEYHIPSLDIITSNSYSNIVDIAWSNLSININNWATTIITSNALIGNIFIPEDEFNNNINLKTFNENYIVNITNLYIYPINSPNCWLVNFNIKNIKNNEFMNINSQVLVSTFTSLHLLTYKTPTFFSLYNSYISLLLFSSYNYFYCMLLLVYYYNMILVWFLLLLLYYCLIQNVINLSSFVILI